MLNMLSSVASAASHAGEFSWGRAWLPLAIFVVVYILLATEVVEKSVAALLGATSIIIFTDIHWDDVIGHVDLNVLFLLIGMMTCVAILSETGFFECVAIWIAKSMRGNAGWILVMVLILTMVFSALLDNVTTIILLAPVTILITQLLEIPSVPFLIMEALASNIGGTATLIGDPPNILIGSQANLSFNHFLIHLSPVVLVMGVVFVALAVLIMKRYLRVPNHIKMRVVNSYPSEAIIDDKKMYKSLAVFGLIFIGFFVHHSFHIQPGIIAMAGMVVMVIVCKSETEEMLKIVEWDAILFFIGLFIIIGSLQFCGVINLLAEGMIKFCGDNKLLTCLVIIWGSAFFSAILDNIPFVMAMTPLVQKLIVEQNWFVDGMPPVANATDVTGAHPLFWALALGACLGGNGTLIGASANIVAAKVGDRNGCPITFLGFMKYGIPVTIVTVSIASIYMWVRYF